MANVTLIRSGNTTSAELASSHAPWCVLWLGFVLGGLPGIAGMLIPGPDCAHAAIYDYTAEPEPGDSYQTAHFRIFVEDSPPSIRGLYFYVAPQLADSRSIVEDPAFRDLCAGTGLGLLGAQLDNLDMSSGIGNAVLRALGAFAGMSSHPELEHTTLFFEGYSWGGQFAYHFTKWLPARVIGFVTEKGGYHDTSFAGEAILVPGYLFVGENDLPYRLENLTGIFLAHRPLGARWILAVQPGAGHEPITDRGLLDTYFRTVVELRLPETIPPDQPVELQTIPEASGWLGDRDSFRIGSWNCYDAAADSACWFPTRQVGADWQSFVSANTVTDTVACAPVGYVPIPSGPPAAVRLLPNHPNPFNPATVVSWEIAVPSEVSVRIYDAAGRLIIGLRQGRQIAGRHEAAWFGQDMNGRPVASGIYIVRLQAQDRSLARSMTLIR